MQRVRALALGALFAAIPMLSMAVPPCCAGEEEGCGRSRQHAPSSTADHVPESPESCPVLPTGDCAAAAGSALAAEKARSDGAAGLISGPLVVSRARVRATPGRKATARRRSTPPVPLYVTLNSFLI
jgi:hypothetical protein